MLAHDGWRPTFKQTGWAALALGLLLFLREWSGYNQWDPDLLSPRPIGEIWWHLPAMIAIMFGVFQMARLLDWAKSRPLPCWIAYVVVLIVAVFLGVWLLFQISEA